MRDESVFFPPPPLMPLCKCIPQTYPSAFGGSFCPFPHFFLRTVSRPTCRHPSRKLFCPENPPPLSSPTDVTATTRKSDALDANRLHQQPANFSRGTLPPGPKKRCGYFWKDAVNIPRKRRYEISYWFGVLKELANSKMICGLHQRVCKSLKLAQRMNKIVRLRPFLSSLIHYDPLPVVSKNRCCYLLKARPNYPFLPGYYWYNRNRIAKIYFFKGIKY